MGSTGGRAHKGEIYEGGLRVPAIIEWPARFPRHRVVSFPASTSDILPTVLDAAGVPYSSPRPLDGTSLLELIDQEAASTSRSLKFWAFPGRGRGMESDKLMSELLELQTKENPQVDRAWLFLDAGRIENKYPKDFFLGHAALLKWPWKLHRIEKPTWHDWLWKSRPTLELYNLDEDPLEKANEAKNQSDTSKALLTELEEWQASVIRSLNGEDYQ